MASFTSNNMSLKAAMSRGSRNKYSALKECLQLITQTESFPFRTWMQTDPNRMRLRSGNICRKHPKPQRPRTPSRAPSGAARYRRTVTSPGQRRKMMPNRTRVVDGRVSRQWPLAMNHMSPAGFVNRGVFCYRLAMIQCLLATPVFYNFLGNVHFKCSTDRPRDCIVCSLQQLAMAYWLDRNYADPTDSTSDDPTDSNPYSPMDRLMEQLEAAFTTEIAENHWFHPFTGPSGGEQGDPIEFFNVIFEELEKKEVPFNGQKPGRLRPSRDHRRLGRMLQLEYSVQATCDICGKESDLAPVTDDFLTLQITNDEGVHTGQSLIENLRRFYNEQSVEVHCERCSELGLSDGNSRRTQERSITQAPDMLVIQLMIFRNDGTTMNEEVPFQETLDLSEFAAEGAPDGMTYRLHGIVAHAGGSTRCGHYVAAVRARSIERKGWHVINDDHVGRLQSFDAAKQQIVENYVPYVLIYQKLE